MLTIPIQLLLLLAGGLSDRPVEVRTLDGALSAQLKEIDRDGCLILGDDRKIHAGDWYAIRRRPLPPAPRGPFVELTNGDRIAGVVADADGDALHLRMTIQDSQPQMLRVPMSALRVAWLTHRMGDDLEPEWLSSPRKRDVLRARNGDVLLGSIANIDSTKNLVRLQVDGKDQQLELSKLAAIAFNTDLARFRRPKGPYYRLTLANGTRLSVNSLTFDGQTWVAVTPFKDTVRIDVEQVVAADVEQGKVVYLSDLKPVSYQYRPYDGEQFSLAPDRAVTGRPMILRTSAGESTFDRGLGIHAECTISYSLGGKYRRFETLAGMDAGSGVRGEAEIALLLDGKEQPLPNNGKLTFTGGPVPIQVNLNAAKELTIVVRRRAGGNVQAHVDLAEARLVP
ncbi:MAG TPA: NPCBM/NEW2 domain-containing protein [Gemmataceae bacterium]|jgi:hypothetical protein|nr:NPCBM/NEW2 domain-containing protein [Gemmataceae bacterium]